MNAIHYLNRDKDFDLVFHMPAVTFWQLYYYEWEVRNFS